MIQITDQLIIAAGAPLQPFDFTGLINKRHSEIEETVSLETEARQLLVSGFSEQQLRDFIQNVCRWGGYPGIAGRVLGKNPFPEIQRQFTNAIDALASDRPDIQGALCEIIRIQHLGLSFASKHLRFLRPDICPVLDSTLSYKLGYLPDVCGYRRFSDDCLRVAEMLEQYGVSNPVGRDDGEWFAADVEMALFVHVN